MIKLVIAEDEAITREAFMTLLNLEDGLEVVAGTGRGDQAVELIGRHDASLAILDVDMPVMGGIEAAERIQAERSGFPVIILTSYGRPGQVQRALRAGVRGFLSKDISADRLLSVIRDVHDGGRYIDPELAADALTAGQNPLTVRETEILRCAEDGRTLSAVARQLGLSEGTVRNHMSSAIRKLVASNRTTALRRAREAGWI
ncbi:response regulator [Streptomyces sp. NPDC048172]|uniref:response regulator n=1 Tax=Streptomyces sp. NPDC048172 TaxID=3365505 RepID=UPI00371A8D38